MDNNDKYIGQLLDGRYEILEKIGTGGMAVVYKARCHRLNRFVAVKILKDELASDEEFRRRFRTESQAVAMLSHPNIVSVYDVSRSGNVEYIVMELIDGITLKQYINRKGLLTWKESLHFATQIAKALQHAHSRGIVHRDIKPHNIMILKDGSVKVADFGIARVAFNQNTLTQDALGSVHYISPEQAKGGSVDARSDIYSLGVVMYEMLTSRLPFVGDSPVSVAIQHISAIPLLPREINPDIPAGLEQITMRAMEANIDRRYQSADELLKDLEEFRKNPGMVFSGEYTDDSVFSADDDQTRPIPVASVSNAEPAPKRTRAPKKELSRDEYRESTRRAGRTSVLIILFLVAVFLFMWKFVLKDLLAPDEEEIISIPKFIGQYYDDVENNDDYNRLYNFDPEYVYDADYPTGVIISQSPHANRQQTLPANGIDISLTVSLGAEPVKKMIDVVGSDYREASFSLQRLGLDLDIHMVPQADEDAESGAVISTVPAAGEDLMEGASVYITYSTGPDIKTTSVPGVVNLSLSAAILRLESYDLTYDAEYVENEAKKDTVIFQSIEKGRSVEVGTKVYLQVSSGPAKEEKPENDPNQNPVDPNNPNGGTTPGGNPADNPGGNSGENPSEGTTPGGQGETPTDNPQGNTPTDQQTPTDGGSQT